MLEYMIIIMFGIVLGSLAGAKLGLYIYYRKLDKQLDGSLLSKVEDWSHVDLSGLNLTSLDLSHCSTELEHLILYNNELTELSNAEMARRDSERSADCLVENVIAAARCIRHWHDRDNGGMVVSGDHVRALWEALAEYDNATDCQTEVRGSADSLVGTEETE